MEPFHDEGICPVSWLEYYIRVCELLKIDKSNGYFFRTTNRARHIVNRPLSSAAVNNCLCKYLVDANLHGGDTPHSLRVGLSNTLHMLGCSKSEISQYLGWRNKGMVSQYIRMSETGNSSSLNSRAQLDTLSLSQKPTADPSNLEPVF